MYYNRRAWPSALPGHNKGHNCIKISLSIQYNITTSGTVGPIWDFVGWTMPSDIG